MDRVLTFIDYAKSENKHFLVIMVQKIIDLAQQKTTERKIFLYKVGIRAPSLKVWSE